MKNELIKLAKHLNDLGLKEESITIFRAAQQAPSVGDAVTKTFRDYNLLSSDSDPSKEELEREFEKNRKKNNEHIERVAEALIAAGLHVTYTGAPVNSFGFDNISGITTDGSSSGYPGTYFTDSDGNPVTVYFTQIPVYPGKMPSSKKI